MNLELGAFGVDITPDAALGVIVGLIVVGGMAGGYLWPSRTSVTSSGFSSRAIPPALRQEIKSEVAVRPEGPTAPRDKRHELGNASLDLIIRALITLIVLVLLIYVVLELVKALD